RLRRAGVQRQRLHRRGGQRRHRVARRVGEAAEGSEGPVDDAAARGGLGAGGICGQHARDVRRLLELRRRLHVPVHRRARVARLTGDEVLIAATAEARGMLAKADEVNFLSGPGKGVLLIKLGDEDRVLGFIASTGDRDLLTVETTRGGEQTISTAKYEVTGRGGKGRELLQRGQFTRVVWPMPEALLPIDAGNERA